MEIAHFIAKPSLIFRTPVKATIKTIQPNHALLLHRSAKTPLRG
jgi:hypothetical protein